MNLTTAHAVSRAKEVGVRKTMGATRGGLIPQFLMESLLYVLVAGLLALGLEEYEGKQIGFADDDMYHVIGIMKDFNFESLKSAVQPLAIFLNPEINRMLAVRLAPGDVQEKVAFAEATRSYHSGGPTSHNPHRWR